MNATTSTVSSQPSSQTLSHHSENREAMGRKQIEREIIINASIHEVWSIFTYDTLLPEWAPVVNDVTCTVSGDGVGTVRSCGITMAGQAGKMVERCVELIPETRVSYLVDDETFGFRKMFDGYGFTVNFVPVGSGQTKLVMETFYTPHNLFFVVLNTLVVRRKTRKLVVDLLDGLKRYVETPSGHQIGS